MLEHLKTGIDYTVIQSAITNLTKDNVMDKIDFEAKCIMDNEDIIKIYNDKARPDLIVITTMNEDGHALIYADVKIAKGMIGTLDKFIKSQS